jgi:hypothetical protein
MARSAEPVRLALRKLWTDHVIWTREYIIAAIRGPKGISDVAAAMPVGEAGAAVASTAQAALGAVPMSDADAAAARLLRNQDDIGDAMVPYYGRDAGTQLSGLLKEHIMIAVELVDAAKKADTDRFGREDQRWTANAQSIAAFLASANPNWPEADVFDLLSQHLKLTKDETTAVLSQDYGGAVRIFDDLFNEIIVLSDALHDGLAAQFPERFGSVTVA